MDNPRPSIAPLQRVAVPKRTEAPSTWIDVTVAPDVEPAIEAAFEQTLRRELPGATRVPIEFETAPVVRLAPEVMGEQTQRMLRALVQIKPRGEIELVQTNEYDVPYMDAIRAALAEAKAPAAPDDSLRWAIVVFWFQRVGEAVTR